MNEEKNEHWTKINRSDLLFTLLLVKIERKLIEVFSRTYYDTLFLVVHFEFNEFPNVSASFNEIKDNTRHHFHNFQTD